MPYKDPAQANQKRRDRYYANVEHERERSRRRARNDGPEVVRQRYLAWKERYPDGLWEQWLKKAHGMRPERWFAMWDEQDGACYICERPLPDDRSQVVIDHDHACCGPKRSCSRCRRGLAHAPCNRWVGILGEDVALMRLALSNFERTQAQTQAILATGSQRDVLLPGLVDHALVE